MPIDAGSKDDWTDILRLMLAGFRNMYPDDERSDWELLSSLMDYFVETGTIQKCGGKYLLPKIDDPEGLKHLLREFSE